MYGGEELQLEVSPPFAQLLRLTGPLATAVRLFATETTLLSFRQMLPHMVWPSDGKLKLHFQSVR